MESAQLSAERAFEVPASSVYPDLVTAVQASLSPGPARAAIEQTGAERARDVIAAALGQFVRADGAVRLDNVFRVVIARA